MDKKTDKKLGKGGVDLSALFKDESAPLEDFKDIVDQDDAHAETYVSQVIIWDTTGGDTLRIKKNDEINLIWGFQKCVRSCFDLILYFFTEFIWVIFIWFGDIKLKNYVEFLHFKEKMSLYF